MPKLKYIFATILFMTTMPALAAGLPVFVSAVGAEVSVTRNGIPVHVHDGDAQDIANRVATVFNGNSANTLQTWYRQGMEQRGIFPAEEWIKVKNGSHVSIRMKEKEEKDQSETDIREIIQGINERAEDGFFGITLAQMRNGEINIYSADGKDMIGLYCLDKMEKYLPDHYGVLREKYDTKDYQDAGLSCSTAYKKN